MSRGGPNERLLGRAAGWSLLSLRVFANSIAVFTGLVEDVGQLLSRTPRGPGARLRVATRLSPLVLGESIAVMGVCLTVQRILDGAFEADASGETLVRSTLGRLPVGHGLHLERAVAVGGRFGGHIVAGHVDGLGRLVEKRPLGEAVDLAFSYDGHLAALLAEKGSPLLLQYAQKEQVSGERTVVETEHWIAVVPYWAAWPFETLLLPKAHVLRLTELNDAQKQDLALALKLLTSRYDNLFQCSFPYS
ncbi:MAG TPA: galactose-1-phosphate uridylyltransferase, partial [Polyangiaceae bacterium]|nr:galactose-1-phosphate uridylyltransferase [Polyangiaceae bacterium]